MTDSIWIVGAHMTPFGRFPQWDVVDLASQAARGALKDAGIGVHDVQHVAVGNVFDSITGVGQRMLHEIGMTGVPVVNVVNACATGATAIRSGITAIKAGEADIALAVGAEQLGKKGLLAAPEEARGSEFKPRGRDGAVLDTEGLIGSALMPGVFAEAGVSYLAANPEASADHFFRIAEKNHFHSSLNPLAQYQKAFTFEQIRDADMIAWPNTSLMCSPTGDGAAAVVIVNQAGLAQLAPEVRERAVKVVASVLVSDPWVEDSEARWDVNRVTQVAAAAAYEQAGLGPEDLDMVELHDCFATAELLHYENLQLCKPGDAVGFLESRAPWRDGRLPVNVSGGLLSKGHPLGATGVAGVYEVVTHLRGHAGERQIAGAKVGMAHVLGLGSACAVHILQK